MLCARGSIFRSHSSSVFFSLLLLPPPPPRPLPPARSRRRVWGWGGGGGGGGGLFGASEGVPPQAVYMYSRMPQHSGRLSSLPSHVFITPWLLLFSLLLFLSMLCLHGHRCVLVSCLSVCLSACLSAWVSVCLSACFLPAPPGLAVVCSHEEVQEGCEAGGGGTSFELADALAAGAEGGGGAEGAGGAEGGSEGRRVGKECRSRWSHDH